MNRCPGQSRRPGIAGTAEKRCHESPSDSATAILRLHTDGEHGHCGVVEGAKFVIAHPANPCSTDGRPGEFGDDTEVACSRHQSDPMAAVLWFFDAVLDWRPVGPGAVGSLVEHSLHEPEISSARVADDQRVPSLTAHGMDYASATEGPYRIVVRLAGL